MALTVGRESRVALPAQLAVLGSAQCRRHCRFRQFGVLEFGKQGVGRSVTPRSVRRFRQIHSRFGRRFNRRCQLRESEGSHLVRLKTIMANGNSDGPGRQSGWCLRDRRLHWWLFRLAGWPWPAARRRRGRVHAPIDRRPDDGKTRFTFCTISASMAPGWWVMSSKSTDRSTMTRNSLPS